jgi:glycosyltransferase involved in cell wall biosynthesis
MKPLVSIIVPVYNTEKYLPRCLNSLCSQSLNNLEIIIINDGSTDRSGLICEEYAIDDKRIRVFHFETNCGPATARNMGIKMSGSDYLMFVDSDDWVHVDYCKRPYETAVHNNADLVMFGYQNEKCTKSLSVGFKNQIEAIEVLLNYAGKGSCNKLYHKRLFHNISFPEKYYYEDDGTIYKLVWNANRVYCIDDVLYFNSFREGSITSSKSEKSLKDWFKMNMQLYQDLVLWGYPVEKLNKHLIDISFTYCIKRDYHDIDFLYCVEILRKCDRIPSWFTWRRKIMFRVLRLNLFLFEMICKLWGRRYSSDTDRLL